MNPYVPNLDQCEPQPRLEKCKTCPHRGKEDCEHRAFVVNISTKIYEGGLFHFVGFEKFESLVAGIFDAGFRPKWMAVGVLNAYDINSKDTPSE